MCKLKKNYETETGVAVRIALPDAPFVSKEANGAANNFF